jgi:DNA modification methylase
LNNKIFSKEGDLILDPFCGSGTVLLEALLSGRNAAGIDSNPLARLISRVKTRKYDTLELKKILNQIRVTFERIRLEEIPKVVNVDHWFTKEIKSSLGRLYWIIKRIEDQKNRDFFLLCFSNCVKKVSLADPRVSVPVRLRYDRYKDGHPLKEKTRQRLENLNKINVLDKFYQIAIENMTRFDKLDFRNHLRAEIIGKDARKIKDGLDNTFDLILTSPPYGGAQKYIRSSSLNLGWLGKLENNTLVSFERDSIGREHYSTYEYQELIKTGLEIADSKLQKIREINPLRAHISAKYLIEMEQSLKEMKRTLKQGGYLILIAANNQVCGEEFETQYFLRKICEKLGFSVILELVDDIKSYGLMTKRNKTASVITREWVVVFRK